MDGSSFLRTELSFVFKATQRSVITNAQIRTTIREKREKERLGGAYSSLTLPPFPHYYYHHLY